MGAPRAEPSPPQVRWRSASARFAGATAGMVQQPMPLPLHGLPGELKQGGIDDGESPAHRPAPIHNGAQFVAATFSSEAGSRPYKLYVPSRYRGEPVPLIVMLHGCSRPTTSPPAPA
jgi:hypothetical protein